MHFKQDHQIGSLLGNYQRRDGSMLKTESKFW